MPQQCFIKSIPFFPGNHSPNTTRSRSLSQQEPWDLPHPQHFVPVRVKLPKEDVLIPGMNPRLLHHLPQEGLDSVRPYLLPRMGLPPATTHSKGVDQGDLVTKLNYETQPKCRTNRVKTKCQRNLTAALELTVIKQKSVR